MIVNVPLGLTINFRAAVFGNIGEQLEDPTVRWSTERLDHEGRESQGRQVDVHGDLVAPTALGIAASTHAGKLRPLAESPLDPDL